VFDRDGKRRDPDYLDVEGLEPVHSTRASVIGPNINQGMVRCYNGYFRAPVDGIYEFNLPARRDESARLNELRAAYQNQLRVGDEVVVQRGIAGRYPTRRVGLRAGWHALSVRLGASLAPGTVTYPDGQTLPLTAASLSRPVLVNIVPQGAPVMRRQVEIYSPTPVTLSLPGGEAGEIRYTLDGRAPDASAPVYSGPLTVDATTTITACVFANGRAVTAPARTTFRRVSVPEASLLGQVRFDQWKGPPVPLETGAGFRVWIAPDATLTTGRRGRALAVNRVAKADEADERPRPDVNLTRGLGRAGFKVAGLKMRENALTIALWFKSDTGTGKVFGKDGYNAFGKAYRTVSCGLENGRLSAGPGHLNGGQVTAGTWQHLVLAGDENELALYLNGERLATGPGSRDLTTDALDFLSGHPGVVDSLRIYNRVLAPEDVRQLFAVEKN
jgi:hypothetical protein